MTSATKASSTVSLRYAVALMDLAQEGKKLDKIESDLASLRLMINGSPDLAMLIRSPLTNRTKSEAALRAIGAKAGFDELTQNFLSILCRNRRLGALDMIIDAFNRELSVRRGEVVVNVQTAQKMTDAQLKTLQEAIAKSVGSEVLIKATVEPSILGGMIVTVGSQMIDDSVARKLERLKAAMSRQSNENFTSKKEVG